MNSTDVLHAKKDSEKTKTVDANQSMPLSEKINVKWKQQVGAAKEMWGKLTHDELLETEGRAEKLTSLVQERYAINQEEAKKQVKQFIDKCKS